MPAEHETNPAPAGPPEPHDCHCGQRFEAVVTPADLKVKLAEQELRIEWQDGKKTVYPLVKLRQLCPCAECRSERKAQAKTLLPVLKSDPPKVVRATGAELAGRYAIKFTWSDGHNTGIYDFRTLRAWASELDPDS